MSNEKTISEWAINGQDNPWMPIFCFPCQAKPSAPSLSAGPHGRKYSDNVMLPPVNANLTPPLEDGTDKAWLTQVWNTRYWSQQPSELHMGQREDPLLQMCWLEQKTIPTPPKASPHQCLSPWQHPGLWVIPEWQLHCIWLQFIHPTSLGKDSRTDHPNVPYELQSPNHHTNEHNCTGHLGWTGHNGNGWISQR